MTQQQLQHHFFDLGITFLEAMHGEEWFGKTPFGKYSSLEYRICRSRYLISIAQDSHIAELFLAHEVGDAHNPFYSWFTNGAETIALWLVGLLKHHRFREKIQHWDGPSKAHPSNPWRSLNRVAPVFHVSALLLETPEPTAKLFLHQINQLNADSQIKAEQKEWLLALAVAALEWQDEQFGRQDAVQINCEVNPTEKENASRRLKKLMDVSHILRAGFQFSGPEQLQQQLGDFIRCATPIEFQIAGALQEPVLRPFQAYDWSEENRQFRAQIEEFKQAHAIYERLGLSPPAYRARDLISKTSFSVMTQTPAKPVRDTFLFQRLQAWLAGTEPDPFWLRIGVGGANNAFDIVASLELDIHLRLPVELVDVLYQKLMTLVGFDASLYRQYAYDLLLRSSSMDAKAAELLAMADSIAASQYPVEHYPLLKMSRQSQSASAKAETPLT